MTAAMSYFAAIVLAVRGLIIPVEFSDLQFKCTSRQLDSLADRAAAYFERQTIGSSSTSQPESAILGQITFTQSPVFQAPQSYKYYGKNSSSSKDALLYEALKQACIQADKTIDFKEFDHILFFLPGRTEYDAADENLFWPMKTSFKASCGIFTLDGRTMDEYAVVCEKGPDGEFAGIGDFCHEFGHLLGLPDFYDTDGSGSGGESGGLGAEAVLMDKGNKAGLGRTPPDLCALERYMLGLGRPISLAKGSYTLGQLEDDGSYAVLGPAPVPPCEFWLLENNSATGVRITHADMSANEAGESTFYRKVLTAAQRWELGEINCRPDRKCAEFIWPATGKGDCCQCGDFSICDIKCEGQQASFRVLEHIRDVRTTSMQTYIDLAWDTDFETSELSGFEIKLVDRTLELGPEARSATLSDLDPSTSYAISITAVTTSGSTLSRQIAASTRSILKGVPPFIMFKGAQRTETGAFKTGTRVFLSVYNLAAGDNVTWTFREDGSSESRALNFNADGSWTVTVSGTLDATVCYEDGTEGVIRKKINTVENL